MQVGGRQRPNGGVREILRCRRARVHGARIVRAHPFRDDGVQDPAFASSERGGVRRRARGDEDAEFAEAGEEGLVGLSEPAVWDCGVRGRFVAGEGRVAVDELDVFAAAAVGAFHDDLSLAAQGAAGRVVGAFAVREAGSGSVGIFWGGGRGDGVEGVDIGEFGGLLD